MGTLIWPHEPIYQQNVNSTTELRGGRLHAEVGQFTLTGTMRSNGDNAVVYILI
jgi:hypothetical protein